MELGPFKTKIANYIDIDIDGLEALELPGGDDYIELMRVDLDLARTDQRSLTGAVLHVEWTLEISKASWGIYEMYPYIKRVYGDLLIEDLPLDPVTHDDPDVELEEYEIEFSAENQADDWEINYDSTEQSLSSSILPQSIEIDLKEKEITVQF
jgi:hypothetical protein